MERDVLGEVRERSFLTIAAGLAVGYGFFALVSATVNTLVTEFDEQPGRWTYVLSTLIAFLVMLAVAVVVLSRSRARKRAALHQ